MTCPHGNPIPGARRQTKAAPTVQLAASQPGPVTVARISEKLELNDDSLRLLAQARLIPGCTATVLESGDAGVKVKTSVGEHTVPADVAEQLYVATG
jgi:hypothetical protein